MKICFFDMQKATRNIELENLITFAPWNNEMDNS